MTLDGVVDKICADEGAGCEIFRGKALDFSIGLTWHNWKQNSTSHNGYKFADGWVIGNR